MLPFATIDFYLLFTVLVALVYGLKGSIKGRISLGSVLLGISLLYAVAYFPKPWQLLPASSDGPCTYNAKPSTHLSGQPSR